MKPSPFQRRGTPKKQKWALNPEHKPSIERAFQAGLAASKVRDPKYMNRGERERHYAELERQVHKDHKDEAEVEAES